MTYRGERVKWVNRYDYPPDSPTLYANVNIEGWAFSFWVRVSDLIID